MTITFILALYVLISAFLTQLRVKVCRNRKIFIGWNKIYYIFSVCYVYPRSVSYLQKTIRRCDINTDCWQRCHVENTGNREINRSPVVSSRRSSNVSQIRWEIRTLDVYSLYAFNRVLYQKCIRCWFRKVYIGYRRVLIRRGYSVTIWLLYLSGYILYYLVSMAVRHAECFVRRGCPIIDFWACDKSNAQYVPLNSLATNMLFNFRIFLTNLKNGREGTTCGASWSSVFVDYYPTDVFDQAHFQSQNIKLDSDGFLARLNILC